MKRALFLLLGVLGLVLGAGRLAQVATSPAAAGPVYTVAALQTHLAQEPAAWVDRTVHVQGMTYADGCAT